MYAMDMFRTITYRFDFEDGTSWSYDLVFDDQNRLLPVAGRGSEWTALEFHKCANCPLRASDSPNCPVAINADRIVEDSKGTISYTQALVTVTTPERTYRKQCAVQQGLLALFALVMATSGCPHLDWFRPLARFHVPFASLEENVFRVLSLQLLTEFFAKERKDAQTSTGLIKAKYEAFATVNRSFLKRVRTRCSGDADQNAVAALSLWIEIFGIHEQSDFGVLAKFFG